MYKVIIADDEKLIREGLQVIIDWEKIGFTLIDTAKNGIDCLDLLMRDVPDVCIIDIKMPGLTGLEVIKECRQRQINTHFIILSGFKDFEYAKQAISYNVENYLLKPIDEEELIQTLIRVKNKIDHLQYSNIKPNKKTQIIDYFRYKMKLSDITPPFFDEQILNWDSYQILLLAIPQNKIAVLDLFLTENDLGYLLIDSNPAVIILKKYFLREPGLLAINSLFQNFSKIHELIIDGCVSKNINTINELPSLLAETSIIMKRRFFSKRAGITCYFDFEELRSTTHEKPNMEISQTALQIQIEVANEEMLSQHLKHLSLALIANNYTEDQIKDWYCKLCIGVIDGLIIKHKLTQVKTNYSELIMSFQNCERLFQLEEKIVTMLYQIINKQDLYSQETLVKKMKFLVQSHYQENLKIKNLSEILHYNGAYLGKVFTSNQGESFNTYLDKIRVEKAKELLRQGYKVYQTAESVGYANVDYFHTKFRKYVGMSPVEYRNIMKQSK